MNIPRCPECGEIAIDGHMKHKQTCSLNLRKVRSVNLTAETYMRLMKVKTEQQLKSMDETIQFLIKEKAKGEEINWMERLFESAVSYIPEASDRMKLVNLLNDYKIAKQDENGVRDRGENNGND